jgi:hypothetical protein
MGILALLKAIVDVGLRFRKTPIVDDDFPVVRDEFDCRLFEALSFLQNNAPAPKSNVQEGYKENAQGSLVPIHRIKPLDILRDELVMSVITRASILNAELRALKDAALQEIAALIELSASEYHVKVGGKKGNVSLTSYDGRYKVVRAKHDYMTFDERLVIAKDLITQCLEDWSGRPGVPRGLVVIAEKAFRRNSNGDISVSRVLDLRSHDIDDDRWKKAMEIITDSIQVQHTVTYLRLYERVGNSDEYQQISLDVAGV